MAKLVIAEKPSVAQTISWKLTAPLWEKEFEGIEIINVVEWLIKG